MVAPRGFWGLTPFSRYLSGSRGGDVLMLSKPLGALLLGVAFTQPASASPCGDQVEALDRQARNKATQAISASTSGKYTAGSREAQGITGSEGKPSLPEAPPGTSATAGKGGDQAQQAKVSIEQARTADKKGDAKGCEEALARARKQIEAVP